MSHLPRSVAVALLGVLAAPLLSVPAPALAVDTSRVRSGASLAVVLFTLPHSGPLNVTPAQENTLYFGADRSVATFYRDASDGAFTLTGTVFGPYQLNVDDSSCSVGDWSDAADQAADAAGDDVTSYDFQAYVFPRMDVCPWGGLAVPGGKQSFINNPALGDAGLYHAAHEFGHDLGADHAHSLICRAGGQPIPIGSSAQCRRDEYGDPFSVMGSGIVTLPSGWERHQMDLLPDSAMTVIDSPGTSTYRLEVMDDPGASQRLLVVSRGDGSSLAIDYRQPRGTFDSFRPNDPAIRGVMVHLIAHNGTTSLVDATPETATFADASLRPGKSLADPEGGVSITVDATGPQSARVEVTVVDRSDASPDTAAPLPPTGLVASTSNRAVTLSWQPALDNVGVVSYRILRNGNQVASVHATDFTDTATTPGLSTTTGFAEYAIQSIDGAGNVSAEQIVKVDRAGPTSPSPIQARRLSPYAIRVSWAASTDNDRVAYYVIRVDGRRPLHTRSLYAIFRNVAPGRHFLRVWAVDRTGNPSPVATLSIGR